jgi:CRP/FNR family transcriptional regulator
MKRSSDLATPACADCPIRHRAVCARCDADEFARLERIKSYRAYPAGTAIALAGDPLPMVANVISGCASLTGRMADGRAQMVGLLLPGDMLGSPGRPEAAFDVTAEEDLVLCCFRRAEFEHLLDQSATVSHRLYEIAVDELQAAREWMVVLARKSSREKVASFLLMLLHRARPDPIALPIHLELPLRRGAMADYVGTSVETVSRQLSALRSDGIIEVDGLRGVTILDLHGLMEAAAEEDGDVIS